MFVMLLQTSVFAQFLNKNVDEAWKKYRIELFFGGAATQILGDLGGSSNSCLKFVF
jgi:hypothetical protein